jgi:DNA polymerase III subunit delta'
MAVLSQIRGQDRAVAILRRALGADRVAHAYLFAGPAGCGKHTTALALASALSCQAAPAEGCGTCSSCERIAAGNHPDVQTLEREGAARIIPIEAIRARVLAQLGHPPHEGRARVYLIEEAGALQSAAANALLKTLEEPPARTHFVLCTTAPDQLLPTIRSRCQRVSFSALPAELRAELAGDGEAASRADSQVRALLEASRGGADLHDAAAEASRERGEVAALLQTAAQRLHDEARRAAVAGAGSLDRAAALARHATVVLETELAVTQHNAHAQLAIESLLYRLRELPIPPAE